MLTKKEKKTLTEKRQQHLKRLKKDLKVYEALKSNKVFKV